MKCKKKIYFDCAATTPIANDVLRAMLPYYDGNYGNPSAIYASGRNAKQVIEFSREKIALVLNSHYREIVFTSGGTESDNLAILGVARANKMHGKHILISSVEHKAVIQAVKVLEQEGFEVEYIPVDMYGVIDVDDCVSRIKDTTILVSVLYAHNEIGTIQPIKALADALKNHKTLKQNYPLLHTDACQAACYLLIDVNFLGVDLMTISGSKIYGPKGVGILYVRDGTVIQPLIVGGGQEFGLRSGTESLPLIVGMSEALLRIQSKKEKESIRVTELRDYVFNKLKKDVPDIVLNGHPISRLPNSIHISIPKIEGESLVLMLDAEGVEVSTGSACSAHDLQVSHVLVAIKQDPFLMHGSLRITLGEMTTKEDCDYAVEAIVVTIKRLRSMSPLTMNL